MGKRALTRLAAAAAGGALVFAAGPALAAETSELELQASHQGTFADDAEFGAPECFEGTDKTDPRMERRGEDEDGWHFVAASGDIESLTVWFAPDGDLDTTDPVEITGSPEGDDGGIDFYSVGPPHDPRWQHAYVFAPAGWRLLTAEATVTQGRQLVVSHTCPGEPGEDNGDRPGNGDESDNGDEPGNGDGPGNGDESPAPVAGPDDESQLPVTGAQVGVLTALGAGLLLAGAALLVVRRRRTLFQLPGS